MIGRILKSRQRFRLSGRVISLLSALMLITVTGGAATIWYAARFNALVTSTMSESMEAVQTAAELQTALANQKGYATYYFIDGNRRWLDEMERYRRDFEKLLAKTRGYAADKNETAALDRIETAYREYVESKDRVIELYNSGDREYGARLHRDVRNRFFRINDLCDRYKRLHVKKIRLAFDFNRREAYRMTILASALVSVSLALGAGLAFVMTARILVPIRRLSKDAALVEIKGKTHDEVALLSNRVHGLIADRERTRSELEQSQELLFQSEKMAMVGKLASEVAHSIRNPMTSIKMRLFSLQKSLALTKTQKDDFEVVSEEMRRLDNIVRNFLDFSKTPRLNIRKVSVSHIITLTLDLLEYRLKNHAVTVERAAVSALPQVNADPELLKEVFVNIIMNACEAMEGGGEIIITEEAAVAELIGNAVTVRVRDTGPGVPGTVRDRIFEPFFSTKPDGTGLGLSIAVRILKAHGGRLELLSEDGEGAHFVVILPVPEEERV